MHDGGLQEEPAEYEVCMPSLLLIELNRWHPLGPAQCCLKVFPFMCFFCQHINSIGDTEMVVSILLILEQSY